ncbi:MAG TPA: molybdenum cofactor guanylyltransferase MobA [Burkholderiales bacterium]|nr:molybdenum cofactor guanylyltransferase MobA [Burkholderiales bacterium]
MQRITGVVLAGGLGRRMGNLDKGLQPLDGRPLVALVLGRLAPQVDEVLISANRNRDAYAAFGKRVIADRIEGYAGPLAGLHAGLAEASHGLVLSVPCDTPFIPMDLAPRLLAPLADEGIDLAVAAAGGRTHYAICLARTRLLDGLANFLESGGRKVAQWHATLRVAEVGFDDQPGAFRNFNTSEDLHGDAR